MISGKSKSPFYFQKCSLSGNEPPDDKTNKVTVRPAKIQISLGIRPVWSESSLCAQWVAKDPSVLHADSEDSDQTGRMPRLIWVFAGRTATLLILSCRGSYVFKETSLLLTLLNIRLLLSNSRIFSLPVLWVPWHIYLWYYNRFSPGMQVEDRAFAVISFRLYSNAHFHINYRYIFKRDCGSDILSRKSFIDPHCIVQFFCKWS